MRHLRHDTRADERLLGPFLFFGILIALTAVMINGFHELFFWSEAGEFNYDSRRIQLGNETYDMIIATDGIQTGNLTGFYNSTWSNVQDRWQKDSEDNFYYENDISDDDIQLGMVRDSSYTGYIDTIYIFERWGWWSTELSWITYSTIEEEQKEFENYSAVPFDSHGQTYELIIITPGDAENHSYYLSINEFWVGISYDVFDPDNMAKTSLWGILGQIMTARLPNVHPVIQYFILIPVWTGISFMIFTLISRMIPFISGG